MKLSIAILLGCALPLLARSAQKEHLELFRNGGFEEGLDGWRTLGQSPGARFELDAKEKAAGKHSLRVERTGQGGWDFVKQFPELPVAEGSVRFSMSYRVDEGSRLEVVFYFFDAAGETIGKGPIAVVNAGRTRKFEREERELEIPAGAKSCGIDVILKTPGTAWIDEVSCLLLNHAPPELGPLELANPSFDADLAHWRELAGGSGTTSAAHDERVHAQGKGSLRLERTSPRLFPEDGLWASVPQLAKAKKLRLALAVRVDGAARAVIALQALDARGIALATERIEVAGTGEAFEERELVLALPKDAARVDVHLLVKGKGKAWFDELELGKR